MRADSSLRDSQSSLTSDQLSEQDGTSAAEATHSIESLDCERLPFTGFVWGSGVECSFLPHLNVDQFQWTQHDRYWREDLRRAREELGISTLRYAFPWHALQPRRGEFLWDYADERIAEFDKLGIALILDVVHFGTPLWLGQAVGDPEFPEALEHFAEQLVRRYSSNVKCWSPFNEPLVSALFSGDLGFWPPYQRRWRGYMPVLSRVVQATNRAIGAIRRIAPEATVILCDAAENFKTRNPRLEGEANRRNLRRFVVMDLLAGRVDHHHPLHSWLTNYGMSELDIEWFRKHPQVPDVLGLDYYPHSDWELEEGSGGEVRQHRAEVPAGLYRLASDYYNRYGLPLMLTETSIDGKPINREIWLESILTHIRQLREEGIPLLGLIWWPLLDQLDWDGALTHRIGKIHQVGLYTLARQGDGTLRRIKTPLVNLFRQAMLEGEPRIGRLERVVMPDGPNDAQLPPLGEWDTPTQFSVGTLKERSRDAQIAVEIPEHADKINGHKANGRSTGNEIAPGLSAEPAAAAMALTGTSRDSSIRNMRRRETKAYGIVAFSHLRWGFVWQRPQQFLSRFAKKHQVLFVEEPFFDLPDDVEPNFILHGVMPNVTVMAPHFAPSWTRRPELQVELRALVRRALDRVNDDGAFDRPLLWYYSPMDASWSLGHFENRGIVYDAMDELAQFNGAPPALRANEARLMEHADVIFAGGYELSLKKRERHDNVHFFGCGVESDHFGLAQDTSTMVPPDIDFLNRPILGWFGVIDERVDYAMVGEMARLRPQWSFAMVGPVVKVDPNLLPHYPNLFWLGQRDYSVLPNYCRAFNVCMMPFAINAATEYINPTKVLEYLATGRPVISTPVKDVVRQYTDLVDIVRTPEEFIDAAERAMRNPNHARIERGIEKARQSSWESTVSKMQLLIDQTIGQTGRRSAQPVAPLTSEELQEAYVPTPGS